jgi:hypothetical protein
MMRNFLLAILFTGVYGCASLAICGGMFGRCWHVDDVLPEAEQGNALAQHRMGFAYLRGMDELTPDAEKAFYWFHQSAKQEYAAAQVKVGEMYHQGTGVSEDFSQTIYWWSQAAEQGHYESQVKLGWIYFYGIVEKQNFSEAIHWWRRAAKDSCGPEAQERLGFMYYTGKGVTQDYAQAADWYRKAAEQAEVTSMLKLAEMNGNGQGLPQSWVDAFFWSSKATDWWTSPDEIRWAAEKYRNIAASNLSPSVLSTTRQRVENTKISNISPPDCDHVTFRQNSNSK